MKPTAYMSFHWLLSFFPIIQQDNPSISEIDIDGISYEKDGKIILADELSPKRYVKRIYYKTNKINLNGIET